MDGKTRREKILTALENNNNASKGSDLALTYGVSRQVIVQDIALLRAMGKSIVSTAEGYMVYTSEEEGFRRVFCVSHEDDQLEEELLIFVDNGGHLLNVIVDHSVYGQITVDLLLKTRRQVRAFISRINASDFVPLMALSRGNHYHTVEADCEEALDDIEKELRAVGFLIEPF